MKTSHEHHPGCSVSNQQEKPGGWLLHASAQQQPSQPGSNSTQHVPGSIQHEPLSSGCLKAQSCSSKLGRPGGPQPILQPSQDASLGQAARSVTALLVVLLLAGMAGCIPRAHAITDASDKAALLAFKANITNDAGLLQTWASSTDPCGDPSGQPWVGIACTCSGAYSLLCENAPEPSTQDGSRVLAINFGDLLVTEGRKLSGRISAELDNLTELRLLNLRQNFLSVRAVPWLRPWILMSWAIQDAWACSQDKLSNRAHEHPGLHVWLIITASS